jgi:hypothetical protein
MHVVPDLYRPAVHETHCVGGGVGVCASMSNVAGRQCWEAMRWHRLTEVAPAADPAHTPVHADEVNACDQQAGGDTPRSTQPGRRGATATLTVVAPYRPCRRRRGEEECKTDPNASDSNPPPPACASSPQRMTYTLSDPRGRTGRLGMHTVSWRSTYCSCPRNRTPAQPNQEHPASSCGGGGSSCESLTASQVAHEYLRRDRAG